MNRIEDLVGKKFSRLTVLLFLGIIKKKYLWECMCDCGNKKVVRGENIKNGTTKSCGCLIKETAIKTHTSHGKTGTRTYHQWSGMIQRCKSTNIKTRKSYLDKNIKVCDQWLKFENFYKDMGECPDGLTLERIDNNKGYSKENCKWASRKEQNRNKSQNIKITYNSKTQVLTDWAKELQISFSTLQARIQKMGWTIERSFTEKVNRKNK